MTHHSDSPTAAPPPNAEALAMLAEADTITLPPETTMAEAVAHITEHTGAAARAVTARMPGQLLRHAISVAAAALAVITLMRRGGDDARADGTAWSEPTDPARHAVPATATVWNDPRGVTAGELAHYLSTLPPDTRVTTLHGAPDKDLEGVDVAGLYTADTMHAHPPGNSDDVLLLAGRETMAELGIDIDAEWRPTTWHRGAGAVPARVLWNRPGPRRLEEMADATAPQRYVPASGVVLSDPLRAWERPDPEEFSAAQPDDEPPRYTGPLPMRSTAAYERIRAACDGDHVQADAVGSVYRMDRRECAGAARAVEMLANLGLDAGTAARLLPRAFPPRASADFIAEATAAGLVPLGDDRWYYSNDGLHYECGPDDAIDLGKRLAVAEASRGTDAARDKAWNAWVEACGITHLVTVPPSLDPASAYQAWCGDMPLDEFLAGRRPYEAASAYCNDLEAEPAQHAMMPDSRRRLAQLLAEHATAVLGAGAGTPTIADILGTSGIDAKRFAAAWRGLNVLTAEAAALGIGERPSTVSKIATEELGGGPTEEDIIAADGRHAHITHGSGAPPSDLSPALKRLWRDERAAAASLPATRPFREGALAWLRGGTLDEAYGDAWCLGWSAMSHAAAHRGHSA